MHLVKLRAQEAEFNDVVAFGAILQRNEKQTLHKNPISMRGNFKTGVPQIAEVTRGRRGGWGHEGAGEGEIIDCT
jgi:hypothetical protein